MTSDEIKSRLKQLLALPPRERRELLRQALQDIERDPESPCHELKMDHDYDQ